MSRSLLKLFFAKNQVSRRVFTSRLTNTSEKVENFYSEALKNDEKHAQNQHLVVIPVMVNFGVPKSTHARFCHPPYPNSGKKGGF